LQRAGLSPGTDLVFVLRERVALLGRIAQGSGKSPPPADDIYPETNLRTALFDGYGVRALVPSVASVTFARDPRSGPGGARYVVYAPTGDMEVFSRPELDSLLQSAWVTRR